MNQKLGAYVFIYRTISFFSPFMIRSSMRGLNELYSTRLFRRQQNATINDEKENKVKDGTGTMHVTLFSITCVVKKIKIAENSLLFNKLIPDGNLISSQCISTPWYKHKRKAMH